MKTTIYSLGKLVPVVASSAYVHPQASVIGDVKLGERVFVAPMASIRGDVGRIEIGDETNVQDGAVIHSHTGFVTKIGSRVNIGHNATIHARAIGDDAAIGMGAVIMLGCTVAEGALIGNSSLLHPKTVTEPRKVYAGVPAKYLRDLGPSDPARVETDQYVRDYIAHAADYPKSLKRVRD